MNKLSAYLSAASQDTEIDTPHSASNLNELVLDGLPVAIGVVDRDGNLIYINDTWSRYIAHYDISRHQLVGAEYPRLCRISDETEAKQAKDGVEAVLQGDLPEFAFEYLCPISKQERWLRARIAPLVHHGSIKAATVMHVDITKRKLAELKMQVVLQEKQDVIDENQKILDMSLDLICTFDAEGRFVQVNSACRDILGYEPEELLGVKFMDLVYEEDHAKVRAIRMEVGRDLKNFENRYIRKDGSLVHLVWCARWDEEDQKLFCIGRDNSEKKRAEDQQVAYNKKVATILDSITDGFYILNKEWVVTYWNREAERITGLSKKDALGRNIWQLFPGAVALRYYPEYHRALNEQIPVHFEERASVKALWLDVNVYPSEEGLSVYCKDITDRKQAEEQLRLANERYEIVTSVTQDAIWEYDGVIDQFYWRDGHEALFGPNATHKINTLEDWLALIHPEDVDRVFEGIQQRIPAADVLHWLENYRLLKEDGSYVHVIVRAQLIRDHEGKFLKAIGATQDVTLQKEREREREQLIKELMRTNEDLQQFTYITSHNFRAPLSNLLGLLHLMKDIPLEDPLLKELMEGFHKSTTALHETVNDLIHVLITKGNPSQSREQIRLREIYDKVTQQIQVSLGEASAVIDYDDQLAPIVYFDRSYLESILLNLLTNSLKYRSYERTPHISITTRETADSVQLLYSDNGIGMDLKRYGDRLFGLYQRFHDRPDSKGLGLYLVKSQIEALGGTIQVESQVDRGTRFTITLKKGQQSL
ncbi:PAS domain-containing sensor histidine kinase [Telluribacter sp. SYSU D00476]|uniref:PAS domain-containing sensor histidine kinase n=1 Tax=Telluribacter sp. SYSU D00476 TaxID=2811430 RepID=UPI001FF55801|nr:PAS domain-containing sensor histidine kinase [Telluribacter sp. SYSU D00476]